MPNTGIGFVDYLKGQGFCHQVGKNMCYSLILQSCHLSRGAQCPGVQQGVQQVRAFPRKASEPVSRVKAAQEGGWSVASVALVGSEVPTRPDTFLSDKMCFWYHLGGSVGFKASHLTTPCPVSTLLWGACAETPRGLFLAGTQSCFKAVFSQVQSGSVFRHAL